MCMGHKQTTVHKGKRKAVLETDTKHGKKTQMRKHREGKMGR